MTPGLKGVLRTSVFGPDGLGMCPSEGRVKRDHSLDREVAAILSAHEVLVRAFDLSGPPFFGPA
jgi:hypothetical protein